MNNEHVLPSYACKCLNVQISERPAPLDCSRAPSECDYKPLYVGGDGISVAHNQMTMRGRSSIQMDSSASGPSYSQQTQLSCLICQIVAYRVWHEVTPESDSKEGPILPTEDWAERDTLKSKTGWIEVHVGSTGCMVKEDIIRSISSPSFSTFFSVIFQPAGSVSSTSSPASRSPPKTVSTSTQSYLPTFPTLFPPPPFTPSHPVFLHLSSIATAASNDVRSAAEDRIAAFARQQVAQIEAVERELKKQVEQLWRRFKESVAKAERDTSDVSLINSAHGKGSPVRAGPSANAMYGSPVIRDFIPAPLTRARASIASPSHGPSALSASLATSNFHHPDALRPQHQDTAQPDVNSESSLSPPPYASNPSSLRHTRSASASSSSHLSGTTRASFNNLNIPGVRRNMDEVQDTAATFRYYTMEAEAAAAARDRAIAEAQRRQAAASTTSATDKAHVAQDSAGKPKATGESSSKSRDPRPSYDMIEHPPISADQSARSTDRDRMDERGRRKVTFDIKPDVVTIKREVNSEKAEEIRRVGNNNEMIFDLEDSDDEESSPSHGRHITEDPMGDIDPRKLVLPLNEPAIEPPLSPRRFKDSNSAGFPQSFAALRPTSLPVPSHVRPPIEQKSMDSNPRLPGSNADVTAKTKAELRPKPKRNAQLATAPDRPLQPHEAEILRLVAAETPSHRGAWSRDSESWKIFERRQKGRPRSGHDSPTIEEEGEDVENDIPVGTNTPRTYRNTEDTDEEGSDRDTAMSTRWTKYKPPNLASSLPVSIGPFSRILPNEELFSLHPKTSLVDRQGVFVPPLPGTQSNNSNKVSSTALRKAAYAERDRIRSMDPGALDFAVDQDDDEDDDPLTLDDTEDISTSRSRQHAFKILKARSEVPEAGMWRSLAT